MDVILASASPRRHELLKAAGVQFSVQVAHIDESLEPDDLADPVGAAKKLAERKAGAIVQQILANPNYQGDALIIGADTMVVLGDRIFGKPVSASDATRMLRDLSGKTHEVLTAVSLWSVHAPADENVSVGFRTFCEGADVTFKELSDEEIKQYLLKGESFDKAGAYAAQGHGKSLIANIEGDEEVVIGLPAKKLVEVYPELVQ